ncbi:sensor histidine kinase [Actinocorallia populi]|uniref:sensor histidine kinase n=1 Tax=Actinocorallia populi TaxID=2079200 RepID=UPI0022B7D6DA|nr:sensor histidine kinase [Actinocorallia populi]
MKTPATSPGRALDRVLRGAALLTALLGVALLAASVWLSAATPDGPVPFPLEWTYWGSSGAGLALVLPGALLAVRLPRHWLAWLLMLAGTSSLLAAFGAVYAPYSLLAHDGTLPLTGPLVFAGARFGPVIHVVIPALLVLFPTGRPPAGRWRIPAVAALACMVLGILYILAVPWSGYSLNEPLTPQLARFTLDLPQPDGLRQVWVSLGPGVFTASASLSLVCAVAVFFGRFRGAGAELRAQLRWMLFAGLATVASMLGLMLLQTAFGYAEGALGVLVEAVFILENALLAGAVIIAVTRYRLYDIDLLIGRTLLYGALAAAVVAIDLALFVAANSLVEDRLAGVAAAGVVAVLYAPLRTRLQRLVDRVLKGRADPYDVVSVLARRLEESPGPDELLQETARGVASVFRSPYVRVELDRPDGTTVIVEEGVPREDVVLLPFAYREVPIGRLALVPRPGSRRSDLDQRLLADVVRQAAAAARATALTEELQRSREQLVTGVAEERRRLRRDLHDGLGPALAAANLKIQAARNLARRDARTADRTLVEVSQDLSAVLADVRRLVHDLRPPALDQFGLLGAIEQQAARFGGGALSVRVSAEGDLAELPAAVEVAVFRIVSEALNNVVRHAGAARCTVRLAAGEGLVRLEVSDDGRGVPPGALVGVGLVAMRERAEELGGRCSIVQGAEGGTTVSAVIPAIMERVPVVQGAA